MQEKQIVIGYCPEQTRASEHNKTYMELEAVGKLEEKKDSMKAEIGTQVDAIESLLDSLKSDWPEKAQEIAKIQDACSTLRHGVEELSAPTIEGDRVIARR